MKEPREIEVHLLGKHEGKMPLERYSMMGD
jgi:hypothetical protein